VTSVLLIDPQFGAHGLGLVEPLIPGARTWPASTVNSIMALVQAEDALTGIRAETAPARTMVARAAGCNTAARLLTDGIAARVLLIDPVSTSTADDGFGRASRVDRHFFERLAEAKKTAPDPSDAAVLMDPLFKRGRLPEAAYELAARGLSRRPEIRARLEASLRAVEELRQPYDERRWPPAAVEPDFDWLTNLREQPSGSATVWLSHDAEGHPPAAQRDYLATALPAVDVVAQPWEEYDFMADPAPLAAALRNWLAG